MTRVTAAEYRALLKPPARRSKYGNVRTEYTSPVVGRRTYDSALEARYAAKLDQLLEAGHIDVWIPQVSIPIPGSKRRMVIDFLVLKAGLPASWRDTKGAPPTREWLLKQELVEAAYGIDVVIVSSCR